MILYHWTPSHRRVNILNEGLRLHAEPTVHSGMERSPYLCFAASPSAAWGLSGGIETVELYESWDLWQVNLPEGADVRPLPYFEGKNTPEIRTYTPIPADHIWFVGARTGECFLPPPEQTPSHP